MLLEFAYDLLPYILILLIGLCVLGMSTNVMTTQDAVKKVEHTIERLDYN